MINLCVCVLDCTASSYFVLSIFPFFLKEIFTKILTFISLIFSADELDLLSEGLDLLGVDPAGYDEDD